MFDFHKTKREFLAPLSFQICRNVFRLALLAAMPSLVWSQIALVHVTTCPPTLFPAACTVPSTGGGNLIVVAFTTDISSTTTTINNIADNAGNVYAEAGAARAIDTSLRTVIDTWYAKNSVPGATSVTISPSSGVQATAVIWEFSGVDRSAPLDQTAVLNSQSPTTVVSGAAVTVTSAPEVIISAANVSGSLTGVVSGNPFVNDSSTFASGWAHLITSVPGTYAAQWNQDSAGSYDSSTVSFKAASTGPSFTISSAPSSQTLAPGGNASYTISAAPSGGFAGTINMSVSGQPSGATASFNPSSIATAGTSTLTISLSSSVPAGGYPLTITGTSGTLIQTTSATLVVTTSSGGSTACDLNKDGSTNVVDVQVAVNNYLSCPTTALQTFASQVITGALGVCPVSTGIHTVSLNWTASTTSGATYNVYKATTSGGYNFNTPLNSGAISGTSFTDCNVGLGQTYYYVIKASVGGIESVASAEISATTPSS